MGSKKGVGKDVTQCRNEEKTFAKEKTVDGKVDILSVITSKGKQAINPYTEELCGG